LMKQEPLGGRNFRFFENIIMEKQCSRCNTAFNCQNETRGCWCEALDISDETLLHLKENFDNCLCPSCLKDYETKNKVNDNTLSESPEPAGRENITQ
jgi:hypothetical protein